MASTEIDPGLDRAIARSKVDPQDEPSVGWGWHGEFPAAFQAVGWLFTFMVFAYLIGNHEGAVENIFIIGTGVTIAILLIKYNIDSRKAKRR
ncbi:DUF2631 domain-containing protein [Lolliginicoccus levis]|uniref:DUF2631 domain-containing protein n=1 Tax=Lolliginicoccus levis TaxID=2919542 RepID=UPI00241D3816|nr:DUF2631 domain-containing protein [Lolliginicoccus levis]